MPQNNPQESGHSKGESRMVSGICVAESIDGGRAALVFLGTITLGQIVVWQSDTQDSN